MGSCCSCCCCAETDEAQRRSNSDLENPQNQTAAPADGKRLKNKRPIQSGRKPHSPKDKPYRPMSYGSSGNELQDVSSYQGFQPLDESFSDSPRGSVSSSSGALVSNSSNSSPTSSKMIGQDSPIQDPHLKKLAADFDLMTSAFDQPAEYPLHDEAASFPQAQNPQELQDITKRESFGADTVLPWVKLQPDLVANRAAVDDFRALRAQSQESTAIHTPSSTISLSKSQPLPPPPSAPSQQHYMPVSLVKTPSSQHQEQEEDTADLETSSATSNDSSNSLPVSRDLTGEVSLRRRASSQDALTWEKRLQLENEIAQHVRIAEMQEEVEFHRRKTAYSDKEIQTIKSQLDQALFKKAAAEAELREFDKRIRARDVQLRQQVEQLEKKVAQGEAAQNTLEKIQKQFSDLEVRLRNEINLKFSTEARLREKERQLAEMQAQMQQMAQEKARMEANAGSASVRTPVRSTVSRTHTSSAKKPVTPTATDKKPPVPRARSTSLRSDNETQSDTGLYKSPSKRSVVPTRPAGKKTAASPPSSPPPAPIVENVDITSKDRSLFATRYMNKTGSASPPSKLSDDDSAPVSPMEGSFVVIPGPEETELPLSSD